MVYKYTLKVASEHEDVDGTSDNKFKSEKDIESTYRHKVIALSQDKTVRISCLSRRTLKQCQFRQWNTWDIFGKQNTVFRGYSR